MHKNDFRVIISGSFSEYDSISQIALSFTIINLNNRINMASIKIKKHLNFCNE